jgi:hypothetical protein
MGNKGSTSRGGAGEEDDAHAEVDAAVEADADSGFTEALRLHLQRLILYAQGSDAGLQREVAEKLANEAVKPERQVQIVELGGLALLLPLTQSPDVEIQRLAAHALANLSVSADNQVRMAKEGGLDMLVRLLKTSTNEHIQRQAAKALANLGVNAENKPLIAAAGGIEPLIALARSPVLPVKIEAIAALANLAVNGACVRARAAGCGRGRGGRTGYMRLVAGGRTYLLHRPTDPPPPPHRRARVPAPRLPPALQTPTRRR